MTDSIPRRFRFGLRTLFVVMTVVSMAVAWLTYSKNWIRARGEFTPDNQVRPPGGLWLFGEKGTSEVYSWKPYSIQEAERLLALFPEADAVVFVSESGGDVFRGKRIANKK